MCYITTVKYIDDITHIEIDNEDSITAPKIIIIIIQQLIFQRDSPKSKITSKGYHD